MKHLNESEMKMYNGGWAKEGDQYLPIRNYKSGDEKQYSGSYSNGIFGIGGKVAYVVYWRPTGNGGGYNYRTA